MPQPIGDVADKSSMGSAHPRLQRRTGSQGDPAIRVLVHARQAERADWIEAELGRSGALVQLGFSVEHVVSALVEDPPPRPQILVADFDDLSGAEILHLQILREQGWFGRIIALGDVPPALCLSLSIERVIAPPLARDALRDAIVEPGFATPTAKMPAL